VLLALILICWTTAARPDALFVPALASIPDARSLRLKLPASLCARSSLLLSQISKPEVKVPTGSSFVRSLESVWIYGAWFQLGLDRMGMAWGWLRAYLWRLVHFGKSHRYSTWSETIAACANWGGDCHFVSKTFRRKGRSATSSCRVSTTWYCFYVRARSTLFLS